MSELTRRDAMRGTLTATAAALAVTGATTGAAAGGVRPAAPLPGKGVIQLAEILNPGETTRFRLAKQIGINHAIVGVSGALSKVHRSEYVATLTKIRNEMEASGLKMAGVESHPVAAEKIKLGLDGRDEEIENYQAAIDALAKIGVNMVCYNFMAGLGWYRTKVNVPERGGALTTEFDNKEAMSQGLTQWGEVSQEQVWSNLDYFLKKVIPVAERAGVNMALHPDDPPIPKLRGIGRILISGANYRRVMDIVPSKVNGVTYCQANFVAMGEDVYKLAEEFLQKKKIFFVHYRDIQGKGEHFRETFHDNGPTDMARILKIYSDGGFRGAMRPDHAPTLEGEGNDRPGYAMGGKVFAIGYMKGIMDAMKIAYE